MGEVVWGVDFAKSKDIRTREDMVDALTKRFEELLGPDEALLVYALQGAPITCQSGETINVYGGPASSMGGPSTHGVMDRLTPEQRAKVMAYSGAEASGNQSLPKVHDVEPPADCPA